MEPELNARPSVPPSAESEPDEVLWEAEYRLTAEERVTCVERSGEGLPSPVKTGIRAAVLGVLAVGFAAYYLFFEQNGMSLFLAILCVAALCALFAVPAAERKRWRREAAEQPSRTTRLRGYADGIAFGAGDEFVRQPYTAFVVEKYDDMMILRLSAGQRLAVPRRAVEDAVWQALSARAVDSADKPQVRGRKN